MPEPQPSSFGSIRQGIPLRSTNRMPVRQARSDRRWSTTFGFVLWNWKKRFDQVPQSSWKKSISHGNSVRVTEMFQATIMKIAVGRFCYRLFRLALREHRHNKSRQAQILERGACRFAAGIGRNDQFKC